MEELQQLLERQAITDVLLRYCRAMDRLDLELLRECFHPDATIHHPPFADGSLDEFIAGLPAIAAQTERWTHSLSNVMIDLVGDTATSEAMFTSLARFLGNESATDYLIVGRYLDRFERREGRWRVALRTSVRDFLQVSEVSLASAATGGDGALLGERSRADPLYAMRDNC